MTDSSKIIPIQAEEARPTPHKRYYTDLKTECQKITHRKGKRADDTNYHRL